MVMKMIKQSSNYLLNNQRAEYIQTISTEYLSIIALLYGDLIESGDKQVISYNHMLMNDAERELHIRTTMYHGRRLRKQRELTEEHEANEQAMLEQLKRSSQ